MLSGINGVRFGHKSPPTQGDSLFAVTSKGEVCAFDAKLAGEMEEEKSKQEEGQFTQEIPIICHNGNAEENTPFTHPLENGFGPGSALFVTAKIKDNADR